MFLNQHLLKFIESLPDTPVEPVIILIDYTITSRCGDTVDLTAQVLGNTTGFTFYWQQISGATVTWLQPQNQLTTQFEQPALRDDKKFRLTINAGLPNELIRDVLVTAMPTEIVTFGMNELPIQEFYSYDKNVEFNFEYSTPSVKPAGSIEVDDTDRLIMFTFGRVLNNGSNNIVPVTLYSVQPVLNNVQSVVIQTINIDKDNKSFRYFNNLVNDTLYCIDRVDITKAVTANKQISDISVSEIDTLNTDILNNYTPINITSMTVVGAHQTKVL